MSSYTALWVQPILKYVFISCPFIQLFQTGSHVSLGTMVVTEWVPVHVLLRIQGLRPMLCCQHACYFHSVQCLHWQSLTSLPYPPPMPQEPHFSLLSATGTPLLPHLLLWPLSAVYDAELPMIRQRKTWVPSVVSSLSIAPLLFWTAIPTFKSTPN